MFAYTLSVGNSVFCLELRCLLTSGVKACLFSPPKTLFSYWHLRFSCRNIFLLNLDYEIIDSYLIWIMKLNILMPKSWSSFSQAVWRSNCLLWKSTCIINKKCEHLCWSCIHLSFAGMNSSIKCIWNLIFFPFPFKFMVNVLLDTYFKNVFKWMIPNFVKSIRKS